MTVSSPDTRPCAILRQEHQVILRVLDVLENLLDTGHTEGEPSHEALAQCLEFFHLFADVCHHGKEEDHLFPVLEARGVPREGGPIGVMLEEHEVGRSLIKRMSNAFETLNEGDSVRDTDLPSAAADYLLLMRQHITKEDDVLFMIGDQVMTEVDQHDLAERFCDVGCGDLGGQCHQQLEALADDLATRWGSAPS